MSANAYEILALAMRYVFAFLMLLIVLRAWRITSVDSRRARKLRRLSPETGIIGEMLVMDGGERAKPGMRYPVTLEGSIGSAKTADIRVRHSSVRRRHAYYLMTDDGLFVRGHASARIRRNHGNLEREVLLRDGDVLQLGRVSLLLVLSGADSAPEEIHRTVLRQRRAQERSAPQLDGFIDDSIFETGAHGDDLFFSDPASCLSPEDYDYDADAPDEYDEYDDE
ncbi:MAG: FHA domain-containing protein [Aristaeellaceae bacterium]